LLVHDQRAHQVPVARFVEMKYLGRKHREPEAIEAQPAVPAHRQAVRISHEKQKVRVAPCTVSAMPGMGASTRARQIAHTKRRPPRKRIGYLACRSLDRANQGWGAIAGALARTQSPITAAPIGEQNGLVKVSMVRSANRDRLAHRQRLGHTGAGHRDYERR